MIFSASVPLLNCTGETLTARRISPGQEAASLQAVVSTHSPSWLISPVSSAIGMNSAGGIMPRSACRQRTSASQPVIAVVGEADAGLVVDFQRLVGDRLAQLDLQLAAGLQLGVHLGFEETPGAPAGGFGGIHRQISVLEDLVEIGAVLRRQRNADAGVGGDLMAEAFEGFADRTSKSGRRDR